MNIQHPALIITITGLSISSLLCSDMSKTIIPNTKPVIVAGPSGGHKKKPEAYCTITNTIGKKDIGYSYMMAKRYPNAFTIKVDDQTLEPGCSITTPRNKTIVVSCNYEWKTPWKIYASSKKKEYTITPTTTELSIAFDNWNSEHKIKIIEKRTP